MSSERILANNLIAFRKRNNISQEEFSFRSGISKETISLIEREQTNVTLTTLMKVSECTGMTVSELFDESYAPDDGDNG